MDNNKKPQKMPRTNDTVSTSDPENGQPVDNTWGLPDALPRVMRRDPSCHVFLNILSTNTPSEILKCFISMISGQSGVGDSWYYHPDLKRDTSDLYMDQVKYDTIKIMGLLAEAYRVSHKKRVDVLKKLRSRQAAEKLPSMTPGLLSTLLDYPKKYDTTPLIPTELENPITDAIAAIEENKRYWAELKEHTLSAIEAKEPTFEIIARFSVMKIFLR